MDRPEVTILAVSNVYCRLMKFKNAGDQEIGHYHDYDHGTLLSSGSLKVEMFDNNDNVISIKIFKAPSFIFINKNNKHRLTSMEDNTLATCIHALRTIDEEIIDPSFFVEETIIADDPSQVSKDIKGIGEVLRDRGLKYKKLAK